MVSVGDDDVSDPRDRRTIVRDYRELERKCESLAKEKEEAEKREKGKTLVAVRYAMEKGGGEKVSGL